MHYYLCSKLNVRTSIGAHDGSCTYQLELMQVHSFAFVATCAPAHPYNGYHNTNVIAHIMHSGTVV